MANPDWLEEYEIEEEKVERASAVDAAAGGRLELPDVGEKIIVRFLGEPRKIQNPKLPKGEAWFARVECNGIEYDMPFTKTIGFGVAVEAKRHGFDPARLTGKVFEIIGVKWEDAPEEYRQDKEDVKTYRVKYLGEEIMETAKEVGEVEL